MSIVEKICKNKNFYGPDIEISDFYKNHETIKNCEIIGYILCRGLDIFKVYVIQMDDIIYLGFENTLPELWYKIDSYKKFKLFTKIYSNKVGDTFNSSVIKLSFELNKSNKFIDMYNNIHSDNEKISLILDMCKYNDYVNDNIFGRDELYDKYLEKNKYNSLERAILNRYIIYSNDNGFCVRSLYSNSIINIKCVNGILIFNVLYNKILNNSNIDLPIDIYLFLNEFLCISLYDVLCENDYKKTMITIGSFDNNASLFIRNDIYNYLEKNNSEDENNKYIIMLKTIFTNIVVNLLCDKYPELNHVKDKNNIHLKLDEYDKKYILDTQLDIICSLLNDIPEEVEK